MCMTSLSSLLQGIVEVPSVFDVTIHGLRTDSRQVRMGDAFVALPGQQTRADHHVDDAIGAGAIVIILDVAEPAPCYEYQGALVVPLAGLRRHLGQIADRFYEHPSRRIRVVGVTGTNGKTSVSHFIAQLLNAADIPCGVLGTLGYGMPGSLVATTHTTPDVVEVNRVLFNMARKGARVVVMEVSSHALDQGRVDGVNMTGAVFTNLSRDHLDYHGSMDAYGQAKASLFAREGLHFSIINFDDPFGRQLYEQTRGLCDRVRYSLHEAQTELWLTRFAPSSAGFDADVDGQWGAFSVSASLMGSFNASNLLAAMAAVLSLGVSVESVRAAVAALEPPPGRLESFTGPAGVQVVVDYAHTTDALANALAALRPHTNGQLICVFGCGGDRDTGKRPEMAREAERGADRLIITDDNPRTESPEAIVQDMLAGLESPDGVTVIHDRADAIRAAIDLARPGDVVLVAGKGHETWQERHGKRTPFSDVAHVQEALGLNGGVA
ncbi:UDP-N-acetylmuramoyl-L-alanyl-D-glutamate--2,6-diaminopimelate ligase [Marinobacter zhanjiangensis]|uniref:UDP-N-acetylmuramoyl-L-alanyl-D-glutamate--2,6-diaminopimelate ligase n=1 Tax=Marinobacter zhanjiangensis TaxID=578215 RepID=A0ABQ3AUZ0_9GAMM|nr:UDP-N-acetylmuramoyl-L-alanyl-D-glutamate--2,6-diaminopimelate ligase [Marinobacter zhanjiangensis]GGY68162.1 UDP-N-acetylmuramoyl-L-alanyl-D-glutamate--2,6-diaminopimelate ligase [Marinobacter zhanjiangensis]